MTGSDDAADPSRAWWRRSLAVLVTVVLVTVGSVAAVIAANTDDGAASADEAVLVMLTALADGDLVGALEALPPGERHAIAPYLPELVQQVQRLGLVPAVSLTAALGEASPVRVEGLTSVSVEVGRDTRRVTITGGHLRGEVGDLPLSDSARALVRAFTGRDLPSRGEALDLDLAARHTSLLAIREGGGWHVSLYETIVDLVRDPEGPLPAWPGGPAATGANTPGETVTDLWKAISDLDTGRLFTLIDPDELHALYEAAPLFLPAIRRDAARWVEDEGYGFPPPAVEVVVEGDGQERVVRVSRFEARWRDRDAFLHVVFDGRCLFWEHRSPIDDPATQPDVLTHCDGDVSTPIDTAIAGTRTHQLTVWTGLGRAFPSVVVRERNGRWFISPTRSVLLTVTEILRGLSPDDAQHLLDRATEVAHAFRPPPSRTG